MGEISQRRYMPPIYGADWTMSATERAQCALSIALSRHIPNWTGATDEQLAAVARDVITALDAESVEPRLGDDER